MMLLIRHIDISYIIFYILHVPYENNNSKWHVLCSRYSQPLRRAPRASIPQDPPLNALPLALD